MNPQQPNFEKIKTLFYNSTINCNKVDMYILIQGIHDFPNRESYFSKRKEFKADFNKWLDNLDIRQAGFLIDTTMRFTKLPSWMENKQFVIDYNEAGFLDLIKIV